jgi:hypothetical protein
LARYGTSIAAIQKWFFKEDGTMRLRKGLVAISLAACLGSALSEMARAGEMNARDGVKQGRHSLISRPSILPHPKDARSEAAFTNASKPLSLVRTRPTPAR